MEYLRSVKSSMKQAMRAVNTYRQLRPTDWAALIDGLSNLVFFIAKTDSKNPFECTDAIPDRYAAHLCAAALWLCGSVNSAPTDAPQVMNAVRCVL